MTEREKLEHEIAGIIAENVTIGYRLDPGGTVNPDTIFVTALGAAHVVLHRLAPPTIALGETAPVKNAEIVECSKCGAAVPFGSCCDECDEPTDH
jgi:hypothetical protein